MTNTYLQRFMAKVHIGEEPKACWEWCGCRSHGRYGSFRFEGRMRVAHRLAYEQWVGVIPDGMEIDHLCRNIICVNPEHLEAVTHQVNMQRGATCKASQYFRPFSPELLAQIASKLRGRKMPPMSLEWRRAISIGESGHIVTEETRRRIGAANAISHIGMKHSEATKAKMADARRAYWQRKRESVA